MAGSSGDDPNDIFIDDTSMQITPRAKRTDGMNEQQWTTAENHDPLVRNEDASTYLPSNASFLEMLTTFDLSTQTPLQSPYEDSFRVESPRWLDEQLEAALDQKRSWRSGFSSPLTLTHDQISKVPVYSPGHKSPVKLELPEYLGLRQEALDTVKQKKPSVDMQSQSGPARGQYAESDSSDTESQDESSNVGSRLGPQFEHRKHRITQGFQEYFRHRTRSLGLEDHEFSSLSWIAKQVVMFHYGNAKVMRNRQPGADDELGRQQDALSLEGFVKTLDHDRWDYGKEPELMQCIEQAWQKYRVTATDTTRQKQLGASMKDTIDSKDQSTPAEGFYPAEESTLGASSSKTERGDILTSRTSSRSLRRRPSALWLFPKPSLSNLRSLERQVLQQSSATGPEIRNPRLVSKDQVATRKALSFSTRALANSKTNLDRVLSQKDDILQSAPNPEAEDSQHRAQPAASSNPQNVAFGESVSSQPSTLSPNLVEPTSALSTRAVKRLSSMPLAIFNSTGSGKVPSVTNVPLRRVSSVELKGLASTNANPMEPFLEQKDILYQTKSVVKSAEFDARKISDAARVSPTALDARKVQRVVVASGGSPDAEAPAMASNATAASNEKDTRLTTISELVEHRPRVAKVRDQRSLLYEDSSFYSGEFCSIASSRNPNERDIIDGQSQAENPFTNLEQHSILVQEPYRIPPTPPISKVKSPINVIQRQNLCSPFQSQLQIPLKVLDPGLTAQTSFESNHSHSFKLLASIYFWRLSTSITYTASSENATLKEYGGDKYVDMKILRKSEALSTSTFSTKSSDADTLVRGGEGTSLEKVNWTKSDPGSTLDQESPHNKTLTTTLRETVTSLARTKIRELRELTGTVQIYLKPAYRNSFTHPKHLRRWHSKNLWCARCQGTCAVCDAACCAYFGAWKVWNDLSLPLDHRDWAHTLLKEIQQWMPIGSDDSTFMDCTTCHRYVCPNCCGICPRFPCYDRVCKNCKADPWEPCDFHTND